ncbi:MAG: beta-L-arabinofuranosidase domain-containing protein, partial [Verrucomicrobiales bacterium]
MNLFQKCSLPLLLCAGGIAFAPAGAGAADERDATKDRVKEIVAKLPEAPMRAQGGAKLVLSGLAAASVGGLPVEEAFLPLRLGEVKPEGWLRAGLERDLTSGYAGHLDELLRDPHSKKYLLRPENNDYVTRANNRESRHDDAGLANPPGQRSWWDAEMIGDWHDSLIRAAYLTGEPAARAKADRFVEAILESQDDDGYIGIYPKGYRFHFSGDDGELWSQRCVLLGLLAYYEFTDRQDVLEAVQRSVKLTIGQYGDGKRNYFDNPRQGGSGVSHGLMYVDVLEWLYRLTRDDAYRRAALSLYDDYSLARHVKVKDAQLARLLDPKVPLSGHGPDVMGFLRVPLLSYYLSGKEDYRKAWGNAFRKTEHHLGAGGSPLSGQGEEIKETGQMPDMHYEYCSTFYLIHSLV